MRDTNLIIGKINSGKTKGVLFKETKKSIENNENLFILDARGEYYRTFKEELDSKNYNTYVINLNDPVKSNGWNILNLPYMYYKNNEIDKCLDCLKSITLELFKDENPNSDPFWSNMSADYVTGLIMILFKEGKLEEINIGSVGTLLTKSEITYNNKTLIQNYLDNIDIVNPIYTLLSATAFAPNETKGSIISVIRQKLNLVYIKENLLNMLSINELDLTNIKDKTAVIVIGKSDIANILLDQISYIIRGKNIKFNFILDNLDNYSKILSLKELIEDASYNHIKVDVAIRDIDEIEYKYGKFIFNKFQNVVNVEKELILIEEGNYNKFPELKKVNNMYFDLEKFIKNK